MKMDRKDDMFGFEDINLLSPQTFPSKEKFIERYTQANICSDCTHGNHEIAGHILCECSCHGNPVCDFCGACLIEDGEIAVCVHSVCQEPMNDSIELSAQARSEEPNGRYPWER